MQLVLMLLPVELERKEDLVELGKLLLRGKIDISPFLDNHTMLLLFLV